MPEAKQQLASKAQVDAIFKGSSVCSLCGWTTKANTPVPYKKHLLAKHNIYAKTNDDDVAAADVAVRKAAADGGFDAVAALGNVMLKTWLRSNGRAPGMGWTRTRAAAEIVALLPAAARKTTTVARKSKQESSTAGKKVLRTTRSAKSGKK